MKTTKNYFSVLVIALLSAGYSPSAKAKPNAKAVAMQVQNFYDQTRNVFAQFQQTYFHVLYKRYERSRGKVLFHRPGKMRWDYAKPNGKVIVSDGKILRVYEPGEKGRAGQVFEQKMGDAQLPQAMSFLTGVGRLEDNFVFRLLPAKKWRFEGQVLELVPKKANPHYKRILFFVDSNPKRLGVVHRVLILDHSGNRNKFEFKNFRFNRPGSEKVFAWKPPKGTRRIKP